MTDDLQELDVPDTVPDDLLSDEPPSQDELTPQNEADIPPRAHKPTWQEKLKGVRAPRQPKKIPPKPRAGALVKGFTDVYVSVGTMLLPFDQPCGMVIINSAEDCAKALDTLARENPKVRRVLMAMLETSAWGAVIAAHLPILTAVAMHHVGPVKNAMQGVPIVTMPQPRPDPTMNGHAHG